MQRILSFLVRPSVIILIAAFAMVQYSVPTAPTEHTAAPGVEGHTNTSGVATAHVFLAPTCSPLCDPAAITAATPDVDIKPEPEPAVQPRPPDVAVPRDGWLSLFPLALLLLVCILAACVYHCVQLRSHLARRPERDAGAAAETTDACERLAAEIDQILARSRDERLDEIVAQEGRARHSTTEHCDDEWAAIAHQFTVGKHLIEAKKCLEEQLSVPTVSEDQIAAALASQHTAHEEEMRTVREEAEACRAIADTKEETIRRLTESKADDAARHEAEKEASQRLTQENVQLKGQLDPIENVYTVNVPTTDKYNVEIRWANGGSTTGHVKFLLDGVDGGTLALEPTGAWTTSQTATKGPIALAATGNGQLKLLALGFRQHRIYSVRFLAATMRAPTSDSQICAGIALHSQCGGTSNKVVAVSVTGTSGTPVWGTETFTSDSHVGCAAVHAGKVAIGETKTVFVWCTGAKNRFVGSTANGITTHSYGPYGGSFSFNCVPKFVVQGTSYNMITTCGDLVWGTHTYA